jgi:hypothetical protein
MKRILIALIFSVITFAAVAQITYETTYSSPYYTNLVVKYFSHTSPKWMLVDNQNIYLYNLNHSLFLQIPLYDDSSGVQYLSDNLFDTDSSNFEYVCSKGYSFKIVRQDNTVLFSRDSGRLGGFAIMADFDFQKSIFTTDSGTKMRLYIMNPPYSRQEIYSLPGTLPCSNPCGDSPLGMQEHLSNNYLLNNAYPNPSSSQTNIPIELPPGSNEGEIVLYDLTGNEIKRFKVDRTFSHLILSTADLASGSYYYQLQTAKSNSTGKKLIVIK